MEYQTMQHLHPIAVAQVVQFAICACLAGSVVIGAMIRWARG